MEMQVFKNKSIVLLDNNLINKIAAGEVIERPASIVKELVENAIDAGAKNIIIEIKNGGKSYIKIQDDGTGIKKHEIPIAFTRHATSKLKSISDLENILTLGFRGEALASIASISRVDLITKTKYDSIGTQVSIESGKILHQKETATLDGTTFIIKDIFFNVPARLKFLKKDASESFYISEIVTKLALGNPDIAFKYINNGVEIISTLGDNDIKNTALYIYGGDIAKMLIPIEAERNNFKIKGLIGLPEISRGNRNYGNFFINNRFIKSKLISNAVEAGYHGKLMTSKFPIFLINMSPPENTIDINVHPTKLEVRFEDEDFIYDFIEESVKRLLNKQILIPNILISKDKKNQKVDDETGDFQEFKTNNLELKSKLDKLVKLEEDNKGKEVSQVTGLKEKEVSQDTGLKEKEGSQATGLRGKEVSEDTGLRGQEVSEDTGLKGKEVSQVTGLKGKEVSQVTGLKGKEVSEDTGLKGQEVSEDTGLRGKEVSQATGLKGQEVSQDTGLKGQEVSEDTGLRGQEVSEDTGLKEKEVSEDTGLKGQEVSEDTGLKGQEVSTRTQLKDFTYSTNNKLDKNLDVIRQQNFENIKDFNNISIDTTITDKNNFFNNYKIIGQIFFTYWIIEQNSEIFLIDQHSAHEKVIYEDLYQKFLNSKVHSQALIEPIVLQVSESEKVVIEQNLDLFKKFGFYIEAFETDCYAITKVPFIFKNALSPSFFTEILDSLMDTDLNAQKIKSIDSKSIEKNSIYNLKVEKIISMSCKKAVKANDKLSYLEAEALIGKLLILEEPFTCPHGRPTIVKISKNEIEKFFKRI